MVLIPAGEFLMGDNLGGPEEQPEHNVNLDSYYIDLYEVTNARYAACVADNSCDPPTQLGSATRSSYYDDPDFADFPVIFVNWAMAGQYCAWRGGSLPTEAQWEKAARGSDARVFPWPGEVIDCTFANFWNSEATCQRDTTAVGSYPKGASPFGLFDMAGNVWEWVQDWFSPDFYINSPADNPVGPADGGYRVLRGGGWTGSAGQQRTTTRGRNLPTGSWNYVGFRCVRTP
jgi:formylglycine-generating enzyme required for sulfatase activity